MMMTGKRCGMTVTPVKCELYGCHDPAEWFVVIGRYQPTIDKYNIVQGTVIEDFRACDHHRRRITLEPYKYLADRVMVKPMAEVKLCPRCGRNGKLEDDPWCMSCLTEFQEQKENYHASAPTKSAVNSPRLSL